MTTGWRDEGIVPVVLTEIQALQREILKTVVDLCDAHGLRYYLVGGTLLGAVRHRGFIPWDDDVDIALPRADYNRLERICRAELPAHYTFINYKDDWRIPHLSAKVYDNRTGLVEERREGYQVEMGVFIDLFPLDGVPRGRLRKFLHYGKIWALRALLRGNAHNLSGDTPLLKRLVLRLVQAVLPRGLVQSCQVRLDRLMQTFPFDGVAEVCNYAGAWGKREIFPRSWIGGGTTLMFEGLELRAFQHHHAYLQNIYGDYMQLPPPEKRKPHHTYRVWKKPSFENP